MLDIGNPFNKEEILEAFDLVHNTLTTFFSDLSVKNFFSHPPDVWSAADNLDHLNRSVYPLRRAMQLPLEALEKRFGLAQRPSSPYADVAARYKAELAKGLQAGGNFLPAEELSGDANQAAQTALVDTWKVNCRGLVDVIQMWQETDLDKYIIPHPAMSDMTTREMLFFTLYHDQHHLKDVKIMLGILE